MKKVILSLVILSLINSVNFGQEQKPITSDSLLKMFQVMKPFEVFEKVQFAWFDFKSCRKDSLLKPYLMKWLDKHEYSDYMVDVERKTIANSPELLKREIQYKLTKQGKRNALDSIMNNSDLYNLYRDSAIMVYVNRYIEEYKGEHKVPEMAVVLHSFFAYPESYTLIKHWWNESGKKTKRDRYFIPLVKMADPEARKLYDEKIKQFIKTNGISSELGEVSGELTELDNSYSIEKMIELFTVNKMYYLGPDGEAFNCRILSDLVDKIFFNSIEIDPSVKRNDPCEQHLKHIPEIKTAAQKLIEKYKAEEYYWMKNMPFYKGEGTGN